MGCSPSTFRKVDANNSANVQATTIVKSTTETSTLSKHTSSCYSTKDEIETLLKESPLPISVENEINKEPKSLAYDIKINNGDHFNTDIESIIKKPMPNRLRHLEPLHNPPLLTREKLIRKLKSAEEKRKQILEIKRYSHSRPKTVSAEQLQNSQNNIEDQQIYENDIALKRLKINSSRNLQKFKGKDLRKLNIMTSIHHNDNRINILKSASCSDIDEEYFCSYDSLNQT